MTYLFKGLSPSNY